MIELTAADGTKITINPKLVKRVREVLVNEDDSGKTKSRVDWVMMQLVKEDVETVATAVSKTLKTFISLTLQDGSKIWFDCAAAPGPVPFSRGTVPWANAAITLLNHLQYVAETPDQVRSAYRAVGVEPAS